MPTRSLSSHLVVTLDRFNRMPIERLANICGCRPEVVEDELGPYARRVEDDLPTVEITGTGEQRARQLDGSGQAQLEG
jgi:hypothetical protein